MMTSDRELSPLEYIVMGLISESPQSGYSIISTLEQGTHRWTASPGSIYPILKRLEKQQLIAGELELVYETRPRKMYSLTPEGEATLDSWLGGPLSDTEVIYERDIVLIKFLFMEKRLPREQVRAWLDAYEQALIIYEGPKRVFFEVLISESTLHQQLIHEMSMMEINMQRTWIQLARHRLQSTGSTP